MQKFNSGDIVEWVNYSNDKNKRGVVAKLGDITHSGRKLNKYDVKNPFRVWVIFDGQKTCGFGAAKHYKLIKRKHNCRCGSYKRKNNTHQSWCLEYTR